MCEIGIGGRNRAGVAEPQAHAVRLGLVGDAHGRLESDGKADRGCGNGCLLCARGESERSHRNAEVCKQAKTLGLVEQSAGPEPRAPTVEDEV